MEKLLLFFFRFDSLLELLNFSSEPEDDSLSVKGLVLEGLAFYFKFSYPVVLNFLVGVVIVNFIYYLFYLKFLSFHKHVVRLQIVKLLLLKLPRHALI